MSEAVPFVLSASVFFHLCPPIRKTPHSRGSLYCRSHIADSHCHRHKKRRLFRCCCVQVGDFAWVWRRRRSGLCGGDISAGEPQEVLVVDCVAERKEAGDMVQSVEVRFLTSRSLGHKSTSQEKPKASSILFNTGNVLINGGKPILHGKRARPGSA